MNDWAETPTLVGRHVTLRPLRADDRDALVSAATAEGLWNLFYASVAQMKDAERWLVETTADRNAGRAMPFVAEVGGAVVGTTRFMSMEKRHRRVEIGGTFYAARVHRTGVNTEAKRMLLAYAFDVLGCQCVQLRTDSLNLRSQAAIERLGARRDGVLRGDQIVDGRLRDTVVYSIVDREWPSVSRNLDYLLEKHG